MSKTVTIRIDEDIYETFKKHAEAENRSLSNFIESATLNYIREADFADEYEMADIENNEDLKRRIQQGSVDAKAKRGRFAG